MLVSQFPVDPQTLLEQCRGLFVIAPSVGYRVPQVIQAVRDALAVAQLPVQGEALFVEQRRLLVVAFLSLYGQSQPDQRLRSRRRCHAVAIGLRQPLLKPSPTLAHVAPHVPEACERARYAQPFLCLPAPEAPSERRPEVVVLDFKSVHPLQLLGPL